MIRLRTWTGGHRYGRRRINQLTSGAWFRQFGLDGLLEDNRPELPLRSAARCRRGRRYLESSVGRGAVEAIDLVPTERPEQRAAHAVPREALPQPEQLIPIAGDLEKGASELRAISPSATSRGAPHATSRLASISWASSGPQGRRYADARTPKSRQHRAPARRRRPACARRPERRRDRAILRLRDGSRRRRARRHQRECGDGGRRRDHAVRHKHEHIRQAVCDPRQQDGVVYWYPL